MNYRRINKPTARHVYNRGYTIYLIPCRCIFVPDSDLALVIPFATNISDSTESGNKFDRMVNSYEYYNCNGDVGYYPHYYVSEDDFAKFREDVNNGR